jgi:hypothetical protein
MTDQTDTSPLKEEVDEAIAEFAQKIFSVHTITCPRCDTAGQLCRTGQELQLIQIDANDGTLPDGGDVNTSSAWDAMRAEDMRTSVRGNAEESGIGRIREALKPLGIFGNSNDVDLIVAVIGGFVDQYQAEQGALQEALESLGRLGEQHQNERDALYTERTRLVALVAGLCRIMGHDAGVRDDPASLMTEWRNVVLIDVPDMPIGSQQVSWHIALKDLHLISHLPLFPRPWNGHTSDEKHAHIDRIAKAMGTQEITPAQQAELRAASEGDRQEHLRYRTAFKESLERRGRERIEYERRIDALHGDISKLRDLMEEHSRASKDAAREALATIPIRINCPECGELHVDEALKDKPHHTHACQGCGNVWRPSVRNTIGVRFLPGFKDDTSKPWFERMTDALAATEPPLQKLAKESP